jgi:hypothetical protein
LFQRNIFKQDFLEEFYPIQIPYNSGIKTEQIYSFENQAGDTEYLVHKLTDSVSAGSQIFTFTQMRNAAGISLTTSFKLKLFNLTEMNLDETLGSTPTLLTTGGIKHFDNFPVDPQVNPFIYFTKSIF